MVSSKDLTRIRWVASAGTHGKVQMKCTSLTPISFFPIFFIPSTLSSKFFRCLESFLFISFPHVTELVIVHVRVCLRLWVFRFTVTVREKRVQKLVQRGGAGRSWSRAERGGVVALSTARQPEGHWRLLIPAVPVLPLLARPPPPALPAPLVSCLPLCVLCLRLSSIVPVAVARWRVYERGDTSGRQRHHEHRHTHTHTR